MPALDLYYQVSFLFLKQNTYRACKDNSCSQHNIKHKYTSHNVIHKDRQKSFQKVELNYSIQKASRIRSLSSIYVLMKKLWNQVLKEKQ